MRIVRFKVHLHIGPISCKACRFTKKYIYCVQSPSETIRFIQSSILNDNRVQNRQRIYMELQQVETVGNEQRRGSGGLT
jgi:hypothetical protein